MRYQNHTFCLSVAALLMSVTSSAAVPPCPNPPILFWDACFGAFIYPSQSSYEGEWELGKHSGYGTYKFSNGNKYVGEFKENLLNGQGTYDFANGNQYIGGFLEGKRLIAMPMGINTLENSLMIKNMEKAHLPITMVMFMSALYKVMFSTAKVRIATSMAVNMLGLLRMA